MTETASIYKGDTAGPWLVGHVLDNGALATLTGSYTCKIKVAGTAIDRAVTDLAVGNDRFIAALNPVETDTLAAGQYVVAIEVANASLIPPLRIEQHIILTVAEQIIGSSYVPEAATELERLTALKAALQDALLKAVGGTVVEVWNGRYGNKMKTQAMTYAEIQAALVEVDRMIAAEQAVLNGLPRRRPVAVRWNS